MANISGIAITIKAFLPTGKTLDEQFNALTLVKDAHASGDYSKVLAAANIDDVKAEQKTRRIEEPQAQPQPATSAAQADPTSEEQPQPEAAPELADEPANDAGDAEADVPAFVRRGRRSA